MGRYQYSRITGQVDPHAGSFRRLLLLLLLTATLLPVSLIAWQWHSTPQSPSADSTDSSPVQHFNRTPVSVATLPSRPLYPYSVIPGGATDAQELKNAVASDSVVAAHYSDFDLARAHVERLEHARAVYVSFRLNNRIYWTRHKLKLAKGEAILTDGEHEARTRCGNRLSETPRTPVALVEPATAELNNPVRDPIFASLPPVVGNLPFPIAAAPIGAAPPTGGSIFIPPVIPVFGGGGGGPDTPPEPPVPPPVPPVATPEPGTMLLLSTALFGAWLTRKKSRR